MADETFDLDRFIALPRLAGLHLSPDGTRLVVGVQTVADDGRSYTGAIWEIDPAGVRPPRRLTRSAAGETAVGFLGDGALVFLSARPDVEQTRDEGRRAAALHVLPAGGGEARRILEPSGGVLAAVTASRGRVVVAVVPQHRGVAGVEADAAREKERTDAGVSARLHERYPMRWWDHPIGPRAPRLLALDVPAADETMVWRDLTPAPPWEGWLEDASVALSDDGSALAAGARLRWGRDMPSDLVGIDPAGGGLRLLSRGDGDHENLAWSPDGTRCACSLTTWGTPQVPRRLSLMTVDAATGEVTGVAPQTEWTGVYGIVWAPDASALFVLADERGHVPVFRVDLPGGAVTRLTESGEHTDLRVSPDGTTLYALRSHLDRPPVPVALDARIADQAGRMLPAPAETPSLRATVTDIEAAAPDGTRVHARLVLPEGATADNPAPLAVFIHGGPVAAFAGWSWRWNAQLMAAYGYAVLCPNPRLSTGYGNAHIDSSWGDYADIPAADILAVVDAAVARPDVDATRTAAMGGSYGGYMANWLAGHTDRFRAIVAHAGLWALDQFRGTSDIGIFLDRQFGEPEARPELWERQSPSGSLDAVRTPMLVIHGERDDRVPVGEAMRLFTGLQLRGVPSQLLLFPDENHWILKPQNSRVWYQTVLAFLDHHVRGRPWSRPPLL